MFEYKCQKVNLLYSNTVTSFTKKVGFIVFIILILVVLSSVQLVLMKINNKVSDNLIQQININAVNKSGVTLTKYVVKLNMSVQKKLTLPEKLQKIINCYDRGLETSVEQHGIYWVLSNYVRAEKQHRCFESVTYTTQGDYTFLGNLIPVVKRWKGPVSVALHTPGTDFQPTIDSIAYLRNCHGLLFKKYVTFHLIFNMEHMPTKPSKKPFEVALTKLYRDKYNCSRGAPYENVTYKDLYKIKAKLSYPINVARNVAREKAQTHFILASDIELYPSLNLIEQFLYMIVNKSHILKNKDPAIFAIPVFEVLANESAPDNKKQLQEMIKEHRAFSFHKNICNHCHAIPQLEQWINLKPSEKLDIFNVSKRQGKQFRWEAVFIGTNAEPFFDERLDWERHGNKMAQAYALCLLNYDYMVLNNAFLIHKPGVKKKMVNAKVIPKTASYISHYLGVQLDVLYGKRNGCKA